MIYPSFVRLNLAALKTSLVISGFKIKKVLSTVWGKLFTIFFLIMLSAAIFSPALIINLIPTFFVGGDNVLKEIFSVMFIFVVTENGAELFNVWIGGLFGIIFGAPIISNTLNSSYSKTLLLGVRRNVSYQISDSIILQFLSPLVIISLIYTLTISLLYRYAYGDNTSLTFLMLNVWLLSVFLLTLMGWFNEMMVRKTGVYYKFIYGGFVATIFYLMYILNGGNNVFGLTLYLANNTPLLLSNSVVVFITFILLMLAAVLIIHLTFIIASHTIHSHPEVFKDKKYFTKLPSSLTFTSIKVLFRYETIKAPLVFMLLVLTPVFLLQSASSTVAIYSLSFILPLIINLTIFINIFGLINSGNAWLASLPKFRTNILREALFLSIALTLTAASFVSSLGLITGNISFNIWLKFILLNSTSSLICFMIALRNSVNKSVRYDFHLRGENIAPPGSSLKLTGQMIMLGGAPLLVVAPILPSWAILLLLIVMLVLALGMVKRKTHILQGIKMNEIISKMGQ